MSILQRINPVRLVSEALGNRGNKQPTISRKHARYSCCLVGKLEFVDRGFDVDGAVMEVSLGGALFRTASTYMLNRNGDMIIVHFEGYSKRGQIMNVRTEGFGIRFLEPLSEDELHPLAGEHGLTEVKRFH